MNDHRTPTFHAHVYFDADSVGQARALCERARDELGVQMGRVHERPVGPHPDWSCQLTLQPDQVGDALCWLSFHRDGLVIFAHPNTGDALKDHTDHAIWMGAMRPLNLANLG